MTQQRASLSLILIGAICLLQPVIGDKQLIDTVCSWTSDQQTCQLCLSGQVDKDKKGLGLYTISCAFTHTMIVMNHFNAMKNNTGDDKVKLNCDRCNQILAEAIDNVHTATGKCEQGQYEDASDSMDACSQSHATCKLLADTLPTPPKTPEFVKDFDALQQYYLVSNAVLFGLSKNN